MVLIHRKESKKPLQKTVIDMIELSKNISIAANIHYIIAIIYIISGAIQPLLMTLVKEIGLGDSTCQIYMLMYYLGPSLVGVTVCKTREIPSNITLIKASLIAVIDIVAQTINYTGAIKSGPTIFAIIYSSVTIWTAIFSRIFLSRYLSSTQWIGVFVVFFGLGITSTNSVSVGPEVFFGAILVLFGSAIHALTYVLSEALMVQGERLTIQMNCAFQGAVACLLYFSWQMIYTRTHFHDLILVPMQESGTEIKKALCVMFSLSVTNLVHALSFFYTLKNFPGGSTSAGVMKGLQAVLVFILTSLIYCQSIGGKEMCFSTMNFLSLLVVITGVFIFIISTARRREYGTMSVDKSSYTQLDSDSV